MTSSWAGQDSPWEGAPVCFHLQAKVTDARKPASGPALGSLKVHLVQTVMGSVSNCLDCWCLFPVAVLPPHRKTYPRLTFLFHLILFSSGLPFCLIYYLWSMFPSSSAVLVHTCLISLYPFLFPSQLLISSPIFFFQSWQTS